MHKNTIEIVFEWITIVISCVRSFIIRMELNKTRTGLLYDYIFFEKTVQQLKLETELSYINVSKLIPDFRKILI